ncbi:MAG: 4-(cytidine 5'-diphospho)-2-C-methyl-D-erythritol kinase, partial [Deltaproteobacteria bacterium RBG_16_42_7]
SKIQNPKSKIGNRTGARHVCLSPAKVNLFLKVLSKRDDGYHNIVSIADPVSLYDVIHFEEHSYDNVIVADDKNCLPEGQANTIYRAVMLLKERYHVHKGVKVYVEKHIPVGSGLGGPSSNAATVLKELSKAWGLNLGRQELMDLGREIGADVPLFLYGSSCIVRGIGERISPVRLPRIWYLIIYPDKALMTGEVYRGLRIVLTKDENDIKLSENFESVQDVAGILENDLEKVAILMCSKIKMLKDKLINTGAFGALMSGSGSSVFGVFDSEEHVRRASLSFGNMGSVFIAHSIEEGEAYGDHRCQDFSGRREEG